MDARVIKGWARKHGLSVYDIAILTGAHADQLIHLLNSNEEVPVWLESFRILYGGSHKDSRRKALKLVRQTLAFKLAIPTFSNYCVDMRGNVERISDAPVASMNRKLKVRVDKDGYLRANIYGDNGKQRSVGVHRLVCLAFHGVPTPPNDSALHRDGDRTNNHPSNLYWGTPKDNANDRSFHNRSGGYRPKTGGKPGGKRRMALPHDTQAFDK